MNRRPEHHPAVNCMRPVRDRRRDWPARASPTACTRTVNAAGNVFERLVRLDDREGRAGLAKRPRPASPLSIRQARLNPRRCVRADRAGSRFESASETAAVTVAGRGSISRRADAVCTSSTVSGWPEVERRWTWRGERSRPADRVGRCRTEIPRPAIVAGRAGTGQPRRSKRSRRSTRCSVRLDGSWLLRA